MTFIYARKVDNLVFFLADTFSRNDVSHEVVNRFTDPLFKIIKLRNEVIVAYAGNAETAKAAFIKIEACAEISIIPYLLKTHLKFLKDRDRYVEFAVSTIKKLDLQFIKNGKKIETSVSYLGDASGMEKFQQEYHKSTSPLGTRIKISSRNGELIPKESEDIYSGCVAAFEHLMETSNDNYGGLRLAYRIASDCAEFETNLSVIRGELVEEELSLHGRRIVQFQDSMNSGFTSIANGTDCAVSIHYPECNFGIIYPGFSYSQSLKGIVFRDIDPYDFTYEGEKLGVTAGIATWRNPINDLRKCYGLLNHGLIVRTRKLHDEVLVNLAKNLNIQNNQDPFSEGIVTYLFQQNEFSMKIRTIQWIEELLRFQIKFAEVRKDLKMKQHLNQEYNTWKELIDNAEVGLKVTKIKSS